ncbi:MAG: WecB/TagA/CpsF family glycosyltransferase [Thermacetogeniaceae bacterium]
MDKLMSAKKDILGVGVHPFTLVEAVEAITGRIRPAEHEAPTFNIGETPGVFQVITLNPEMLYRARYDQNIRQLLNRGDLVVPDGYGVVWAGEHLGCSFPERVAGIELLQSLAVRAAAAGWRLYLLGGAPGVAADAAANLQRQHPGLQVAGTGHGYFGEAELPAVLQRIREADPDLLLVGMGFPKQEQFIDEHRQQLGRLVAVGVGGSFDVVSGRLRRSPLWMQQLRLEWLFRAFQEPARWRRLLVLPRFIGMVLLTRQELDSGKGNH